MPKAQVDKCPMCKGKGSIPKAKNTKDARLRRRSGIAKQLRAEGYTIREIMSLMGYASPQSVTLLLKEKIEDENL